MPDPAEIDPLREGNAGERRLLLVSTGERVIALPAETVVEVLTARPYTRIPGTMECVAGLVNRRGRLLTVIDLGLVLRGASASSTADDHRIIVVAYRGRDVGLAVHDVLQMTMDWWSDVADATEAAEEDAGQGDQRLSVVEIDSVLGAIFSASDAEDEEPSPEGS